MDEEIYEPKRDRNDARENEDVIEPRLCVKTKAPDLT